MSRKKISIIGSGFSGLSAASYLARAGYEVTVLEKNNQSGGRARQFKQDGFTFDMGPSWYWMPDVFEQFFADFGKSPADYYQLKRLDPSYRVYFSKNEVWDIPASLDALKALFEETEKGASRQLTLFLQEAAYKYRVGMNKLAYKPGLSLMEFANIETMSGLFRLDLFQSMHKHLRKYFKDERLLQLMEFPVLFLGATAQNTPALYSLMNYADIQLGTWYPMGGMYKIVEAMQNLAQSMGVQFQMNQEIRSVSIEQGNRVAAVESLEKSFLSDAVLAAADYQYIDKHVLAPAYSNYSEDYWDKRLMAPSCLLYYIGLDCKLKNLKHHNLFFDQDFQQHAREIYENPQWPTSPLFYVSVPSVTDDSVAPAGMENLFILIPVAAGLVDDEDIREKYYNLVIKRLEQISGESVFDHVKLKKTYAYRNFVEDYHAFKGNAYGLANTLQQTALLKPRIRNRKLPNLYYTGQLTVPGPGVPPAIISGKVVAEQMIKNMQKVI